MVLSFPERSRPRPASPHELALAALARAVERACPPPSARTLPDELRVLLTRLRQPRKQTRSRRVDAAMIQPVAGDGRMHPG
jgi:hypothetical protein